MAADGEIARNGDTIALTSGDARVNVLLYAEIVRTFVERILTRADATAERAA